MGFHWSIMGAQLGKIMQHSTLVWHHFCLLTHFFYDVRNIINILTRVGKTIILTVYHLLTFLNHKTKFILTNNLIYGYKIIPKIHKNSNIHSTDAVTKQN